MSLLYGWPLMRLLTSPLDFSPLTVPLPSLSHSFKPCPAAVQRPRLIRWENVGKEKQDWN